MLVFYDFCTPAKEYRVSETLFYHSTPIWNTGSLSDPCHVSVSQGLRNVLVVIPVTAYKMLIIYLNSIADEQHFNGNQMDKNDNKNFK